MKKIKLFSYFLLLLVLCFLSSCERGEGNRGGTVKPPAYNATEGLNYFPLSDGTYAVSEGNAIYLEEIVIPSKHNGKEVTVIAENGFSKCVSLKKIHLPNTIKKIESYAFSNCSLLKYVQIPLSVKIIENTAFPSYPNNTLLLTKLDEIPSEYKYNKWCILLEDNYILENDVLTLKPTHSLKEALEDKSSNLIMILQGTVCDYIDINFQQYEYEIYIADNSINSFLKLNFSKHGYDDIPFSINDKITTIVVKNEEKLTIRYFTIEESDNQIIEINPLDVTFESFALYQKGTYIKISGTLFDGILSNSDKHDKIISITANSQLCIEKLEKENISNFDIVEVVGIITKIYESENTEGRISLGTISALHIKKTGKSDRFFKDVSEIQNLEVGSTALVTGTILASNGINTDIFQIMSFMLGDSSDGYKTKMYVSFQLNDVDVYEFYYSLFQPGVQIFMEVIVVDSSDGKFLQPIGIWSCYASSNDWEYYYPIGDIDKFVSNMTITIKGTVKEINKDENMVTIEDLEGHTIIVKDYNVAREYKIGQEVAVKGYVEKETGYLYIV